MGMPAQVSSGVQRGSQQDAKKVIEYARAQIGKPYRWAATGPDEFDCSGLTMRAWERGGVALAHWSVAQYAQGKKIPLSEIRPGDLVFFSTGMCCSTFRANPEGCLPQ